MTHPSFCLLQRRPERATPAALGRTGVLRLIDARGPGTPSPSNGGWNRVVPTKRSHPILLSRYQNRTSSRRNRAQETVDG